MLIYVRYTYTCIFPEVWQDPPGAPYMLYICSIVYTLKLQEFILLFLVIAQLGSAAVLVRLVR